MYLDIRASRKISWKHLFLGFFLVICQTGWRILLFLDCFFTFIWPLKVFKTLFTYFNHQIKSITSLNCNMTLIQLVFSRGDSALCYLNRLRNDPFLITIWMIGMWLIGLDCVEKRSFSHVFLQWIEFLKVCWSSNCHKSLELPMRMEASSVLLCKVSNIFLNIMYMIWNGLAVEKEEFSKCFHNKFNLEITYHFKLNNLF